MHKASFQKELPDEKVQCLLCPHLCILHDRERGLCRTRENIGGVLWTFAYKNPCSIAFDFIEKNPLYHFHPHKKALSIATGGCNFRCTDCHNAEISQSKPEEVSTQLWTVDAVIRLAKHEKLEFIAFAHTEPIVFYEYMLDIAKLAKQNNIKTVLVSNGYIQEEPLNELIPYLDAASISLKSMDDSVYKELTGGSLQPVLNTLTLLQKSSVWLEVSTMLIPGFTDDSASISRMCQWLFSNGFENTPLHFSICKASKKKLNNFMKTDLYTAIETASKAGLSVVYCGTPKNAVFDTAFKTI